MSLEHGLDKWTISPETSQDMSGVESQGTRMEVELSDCDCGRFLVPLLLSPVINQPTDFTISGG